MHLDRIGRDTSAIRRVWACGCGTVVISAVQIATWGAAHRKRDPSILVAHLPRGEMKRDYDHLFKLVLIGDSGAGPRAAARKVCMVSCRSGVVHRVPTHVDATCILRRKALACSVRDIVAASVVLQIVGRSWRLAPQPNVGFEPSTFRLRTLPPLPFAARRARLCTMRALTIVVLSASCGPPDQSITLAPVTHSYRSLPARRL